MKKIAFAIFFLFFLAAPAAAENVTVFDLESGDLRLYDVRQSGDRSTVFDLQDGSVTTGRTTGDRTTYYNNDSGNMYDMQDRGNGRYTGYDYEDGTVQEYRRMPNGDVILIDDGRNDTDE